MQETPSSPELYRNSDILARELRIQMLQILRYVWSQTGLLVTWQAEQYCLQ